MFRALLIYLALFACLVHANDNLEALKKAAEQGHASAQLNLGNRYDLGEGVPEDDIQAYAWLSIAAAQGDELAKENKDILTKEMTREQIADAQKLSREYWQAYGPDRKSE